MTVDLKDLTIAQSRIPKWDDYPPGVEGGRPDTSGWPVLDATDPAYGCVGDGVTNNNGGGATNMQDVIDAANAAAEPTVAYFPEGVYYHTAKMILKSDVVIRGDGKSKTKFLVLTGNVSPIGWNGNIQTDGSHGSDYAISSGGDEGDTQITLASSPGWQIGDWIEIFYNDEPPWIDNQVTGGGRYGYGGQVVKITGVNGAVIDFDYPLRMDFTQAYSPRAHIINVTENCGVETLCCEMKYESEAHSQANIAFYYVVNGWVYDVECYRGYNTHIRVARTTARCTFEKCYLHTLINFEKTDEGGDGNYSLSLTQHACDNLIINNVFVDNSHSVVPIMGANGNVIAYNYVPEPARGVVIRPGRNYHGLFFHGSYPHANLVEGNDLNDSLTMNDDWWGRNGKYNTVFRNRIHGYGDNAYLNAFGIHGLNASTGRLSHEWANIILNSPFAMFDKQKGLREDWEDLDRDTTNSWFERNVYRDVFYLVPEVTTTSVDNVQSNYPPAGWSGDEFPASLYLSAAPSWWGDRPWPCIGADIDDFTGTLNKLPAQEWYEEEILGMGGSVQPVPISNDHTVFMEF